MMYHPDELLQKVNAFIDQLPYDRQPVSLYEPILVANVFAPC